MNAFKKIIFSTLLLAVSYICSAQEISIRGGLNLSQMPTKWDGKVTDKNSELKSGYHIGPVIDFHINNLFSCETGMLYTTKGLRETSSQTINSTRSLMKINITYVEIPFSLKASFPFRNITFFGSSGGYIASGLFGHVLSMEDINGTNSSWEKINWGDKGDALKRLDYGLIFGIGMKIKAIQLGICHEMGMSDLVIADPASSRTYNKTFELYVSYNIWNRVK